MANEVPAAETISVLVQASGQGDAYFMALLRDGHPIAQFGWPLEGWKDFAQRILTQVAAFEGGSNLEVPLLMIASEMNMAPFSKTLDFAQFRDHFPYSFTIHKDSKDPDAREIIIRTRRHERIKS